MEFFEKQPPTDQVDLQDQYLSNSYNYPCAKEHAALVLGARARGVQVVGLHSRAFSKEHFQVWHLLLNVMLEVVVAMAVVGVGSCSLGGLRGWFST
jgi:hypothetical protein